MKRTLQYLKRLWLLESFRPDIALSRDEASRFLPWIIALMVYLAALTLTGGFTLHHTIMTGHAMQAESFSVHIPNAGDKSAEIADKAVAILKSTPGVADVSLLSTARIREMVEPWLGKSDSLNSLPLPLVIEARIISGAGFNYDTMKSRLNSLTTGIEIDDHKQWMEQFTRFVHMVQMILFAVAALIITASGAVVIFACKTSLKIHRGTVSLLHRLGAMDGYIASQFQHHATLLALKGAFVGSGFAAGTLLTLYLMARHLHSPLFPSFDFSFSHALILISLPVLMSLIALLSARMSVLSTLRKMP